MKVVNTLRQAKARAIRRKISKSGIAIVSTRRSGSTLLADVIAANRGIWFANEPFAVFPEHPEFELKSRLLPPKEHSQFFQLSGDELERFETYTNGLLSAAYPQLGTCRRVKFPLLADRVCLKILNAPWMLDWFLAVPNCSTLFLIRHPGAQASSVLRQGWEFAVEAYFRSDEALQLYFNNEQIDLGNKVLRRGDPWEVAILDWIVLNTPGIRCQNPSLQFVYYEELVTNPLEFSEKVLNKGLDLCELRRMNSMFDVPSNSSMMSSKDTRLAIKSQDKTTLLSGWMSKIGNKDLDRAQTLLDRFEISLYSMREARPLAHSASVG